MNKDPTPVLLKSTSRSKFTFEMGNLLAALVALSMMVFCHCHRRAEVQGNGRSSADMKSTALDNSHRVPFMRSVLKKYQPKYPAFLNFQHLLLLLTGLREDLRSQWAPPALCHYALLAQ